MHAYTHSHPYTHTHTHTHTLSHTYTHIQTQSKYCSHVPVGAVGQAALLAGVETVAGGASALGDASLGNLAHLHREQA